MSPAAACPVCRVPHPLGDPVDAPAVTGRVSVVVTHYEQHDDLARTLRALRRQSVPPHEVIVTDDGSDRRPQVPAGVRLLTQPDTGFRAALARNRAAAVATGDVLVFLDADTTPAPGYVEALTTPLLTEPDLLLVGTRRFAAEGSLDRGHDDPLHGAEDHELAAPHWLAEGWRDTDDLRAADHTSFRYVVGAVTACATGWFERVGGFDPSFSDYGGEDWDLSHRWWTAGGRLRHVPDAVAWHHGPDAASVPRAWDRGGATAQTLALASRVHAEPLGFRGLLAGPARVVLTLAEDGLDERALVAAVDSFLAEVPQAAVVSDHPVWERVVDPRVRPTGSPDLRTAAVRVHLHAPVVGAGGAWRALVRTGSTTTTYDDAEGTLAVVTDLRLLRRSHLGLGPGPVDAQPPPSGLRRLGDTPLAAWLGGWADP